MHYILWIIGTTLYLVAIADVLRSHRTTGEKIVLTALILALPYVGPIIYLFLLREKS